MKLIKNNLKLIAVAAIATGLFFAGYSLRGDSLGPQSIQKASQDNKTYYISFDDYYYEVPKQKTVDDRILPGGQFIYNFNTAIKTNTLDDIFNSKAIGVQALVPLNGDAQAFERYLNTVIKSSTASAFAGSAELSFAERERDKLKTAELVSKKGEQTIRRQYIVNLPQAVVVVTKDDSEAFRDIGRTVGQASTKFSDYNAMKLQVLGQGSMLKNRMFEDMYRLAHSDFRGATSIDEINQLADRSKEMFNLETKVTGIKLSKDEMTATVHFIDAPNPANSKTSELTFRQFEGQWKLFAIKLPYGVITGAAEQKP